jgi:hypothetical protein
MTENAHNTIENVQERLMVRDGEQDHGPKRLQNHVHAPKTKELLYHKPSIIVSPNDLF